MATPVSSSNFVHLHVHSDYSLLDGMGNVEDIVKKVKSCGMTACAITDHGTGAGLPRFYSACNNAGIKPILGCEMYVAPECRFDKSQKTGERAYYHLVLLVKDEQGYKNLCYLISRSNTEGFYIKPRIDFELLSTHYEGLICLSACVAGEVQQYVLKGERDKAVETARRYKKLFGEDYYLEIQNHGLNDEMLVAKEFMTISQELSIKIVCTNDCHYVDSDDAEAHEWLLCLQTKKNLKDKDRMIYSGDYSIKSESEMRNLFPELPEAFDNTVEVASKCNFEFEYGNYRMPRVTIPAMYGNNFFKYLSDEAWRGIECRYKDSPDRGIAEARLKYELDIVRQMGFAEYFLDTRKTILWAKENGILVGPGRGSAAGSVMCYCLKITDIDPIRYNLLFERFLNPERVSMPDIDVDYDNAYKDAVVAAEAESNGKSCFAKIQTFTTMLPKGVLRDCARVAGYSASVGSALSKMIPNEPGITLKMAWNKNPEIKEFIASDTSYMKLWKISEKLEGVKKAASTHACGHIPTPIPCEELFPVSVDKDTGYLICQYDMIEADHLGNLKKDLLMLGNLTVINVAQKLIKERYDIEIPLWTDFIVNDQKSLDMISRGETDGVFQLESEGMKDFLKRLRPDCFEDIIAGVSLYRPGPIDFIPKYIEGKRNTAAITYATPELEEILSPTYGVIVYQEQVMQITQKLAGFTMGHADVVRKAMGKKKQAIMDAEEPLFISGCMENGISEQIASDLWDIMKEFAKYAFNKSHAACYAAISMQTAYLKCHYPLEFMAGLLSSAMDDPKKLPVYINVCKRSGIKILPPDINFSERGFTIQNDCIRYGLQAIKKAGAIIDTILIERNAKGLFAGVTDLISRIPSLNKGAVESFIKAGALDFCGQTRRTLLANLDRVVKGIRKDSKSQVEGQISMFSGLENDGDTLIDSFIPLSEYEVKELLQYEREATGIYISGHPLEGYSDLICKNTSIEAISLQKYDTTDADNEGYVQKLQNGMEVCIAGVVLAVKVIYTKKTGRAMALLDMEDLTGTFSCVVFPDIYDKYKAALVEDKKLLISGRISEEEEKDLSILANTITEMDKIPRKVWIQFATKEEYVAELANLAAVRQQYAGSDLFLIYDRETGKPGIRRSTISASSECITKMKEMYGEENVKVTY